MLFKVALLAIADDEGDGIFLGIGEADSQSIEAQFIGFMARFAVKIDYRLATAFGYYLYLFPANAPDSGAQGFHYRFLAGEATGETPRLSAAYPEFWLSEYPAQETLPPAVYRLFNAGYLYDIDTNVVHRL